METKEISKRPTLSELFSKSNELTDLVIAAGGELSSPLEQAINEIEISTASKIDGYKFAIQRMDAEHDFLVEIAEEYLATAKALKNTGKRIKDRLLQVMTENGITEAHGNTTRVAIVPNAQSLVITDESLVPEEFKVIIPASLEIDKKKLKKALEDLQSIPGAELKGGAHVRFLSPKKG